MGFLFFDGRMYLPCAIVIAGEEALAPPIKDVVLVHRGQYARSQAVVEQDLQVVVQASVCFCQECKICRQNCLRLFPIFDSFNLSCSA
jgi:hypothetical protein